MALCGHRLGSAAQGPTIVGCYMRRQGKEKRTAPHQLRAKAAQAGRPARRPSAASKGPVRPQNHSLLVVGLGASAGGLEAVRKLLATLPAHTGMAFVLIQH